MNREYGDTVWRFENQRALAWLDEELGRLGNDGHPKTEAVLRAVKDDLEFEVSLMKRVSLAEPPAKRSSDPGGRRRV